MLKIKSICFLLLVFLVGVFSQDEPSAFFVRDVFITEADRQTYRHYLHFGLRLNEEEQQAELTRWEYAVSIVLFNDVYFDYASLKQKEIAHYIVVGHLKGKLALSYEELIAQGKQRLREHQYQLKEQGEKSIDETSTALVEHIIFAAIVVLCVGYTTLFAKP